MPNITGVVQLALPPAESREIPENRTVRSLAIPALFVVTLLLGYLGWILPSVGGSVIVPTGIVFGIGLCAVVIGCILAAYRPQWKLFAIGAIVGTILASVWTFQFSLAMQVEFSRATTQANAALSALEHSPSDHHGTVPLSRCTLHSTGSVGPMPAPYLECPIFTPEGHIVTFKRLGNQPGALVYVQDLGFSVNAFPDQCVRPLIGGWSMTTDPQTDTGSTCPIGYQDSGGG
jgi:hypothetical protein